MDRFLDGVSELEVDDEFRTELLGSKISDDEKRVIIRDMDTGAITTDASRASVVGPILERTSFDAKELRSDFVHAIIVNTKDVAVQISLLNKSQQALTKQQVRGILENLPDPSGQSTE